MSTEPAIQAGELFPGGGFAGAWAIETASAVPNIRSCLLSITDQSPLSRYLYVMEGFTLGRRPALDGLRGVAILFVLGTHMVFLWPGIPWFHGGFVGVDIFFALSGFLITSILVEEWQRSGDISLRSFYRRRAYRLFPALAVVVFATFAYTLVARAVWPLGEEAQGVSAVIFYGGNWLQTVRPGAWGLSQTWSLGIEEQFYFLWPVLLLALLRLRRQGGTAVVVGGVILTSAFLCAWAFHLNPASLASYYETQGRIGELLVGAGVALLLHRGWRPGAWIRPAGYCAAAFLGWLLFTNFGWVWVALHDGGFTLIAVATCTMILAILEPRGGLYRALSWQPMRFLGHISYSLYLWHIPVIEVMGDYKSVTGGVLQRSLMALALTVALSLASYYFIEQPFLRMSGPRARTKQVTTQLGMPSAVAS